MQKQMLQLMKKSTNVLNAFQILQDNWEGNFKLINIIRDHKTQTELSKVKDFGDNKKLDNEYLF